MGYVLDDSDALKLLRCATCAVNVEPFQVWPGPEEHAAVAQFAWMHVVRAARLAGVEPPAVEREINTGQESSTLAGRVTTR